MSTRRREVAPFILLVGGPGDRAFKRKKSEGHAKGRSS